MVSTLIDTRIVLHVERARCALVSLAVSRLLNVHELVSLGDLIFRDMDILVDMMVSSLAVSAYIGYNIGDIVRMMTLTMFMTSSMFLKTIPGPTPDRSLFFFRDHALSER